jgi:hypothetical protein
VRGAALLLAAALALGGACGIDAGGGGVGAGDERPASLGEAGADPGRATAGAVRPPAGRFDIVLSGTEVVSGDGAPDGGGWAVVTLQPDRGELCYEVTVTGIGSPTGAHLHEGSAGTAGRVVLSLQPPAEGAVTACATVAKDLLGRITAQPQRYYLSVHTDVRPDGAIRGQLG